MILLHDRNDSEGQKEVLTYACSVCGNKRFELLVTHPTSTNINHVTLECTSCGRDACSVSDLNIIEKYR